ncbi:helix-turn-helix transcriptional regulator [Thioclava sp. 'Guangxiensis']|uniref:helix-turn-helix transcriptional regulator n=1 Tax=unclassified Thioclava TaxID=2621713 RepID=UPI003878146D
MEKLRAYITGRSLTLEAFAKSVGCSTVHISTIVRGKKRPSLDLAIAIEDATSGEVRAIDFKRGDQ